MVDEFPEAIEKVAKRVKKIFEVQGRYDMQVYGKPPSGSDRV